MIKTAENKFDKELETQFLNEWLDGSLYKKLREKNKDGEGFYLCFGPPYPSGRLHLGTGLNGVWKDLVSRYKFMQGFDVEARPGWDMHGLPIEQKVEKAFDINKTKLEEFGVEKFIEECKKFSEGNKEVMTQDFKNLGCVVFDWEDPYRTMSPEYMFGSWAVVKTAHDKDLLVKGKFPVTVCPRCQTALSKAEGPHKVKKDESVYVLFKVQGKEEYLLAWTTTPWTLPSNQGIMVHPDFEYVKARVDGKEVWVAKELLETVMEKSGKEFEVLETKTGKEFEGVKYAPLLKGFTPLQEDNDKAFKVILSKQYVNLEEGTGLVHTAPGHGKEDYHAGKDAGLPIVNPVQLNGTYASEAGENLAGKHVFKANTEIVQYLEENDKLFHSEEISHEYPHCWRCSTPLLQLAMPNWFIKMKGFKEKLLEENKNVNWVPESGGLKAKERISSIDDWCISRQRYWGIPLPIWDCEACGKTTVIGSLKELQEKSIEDVKDDFDPHIPYVDEVKIKCECGKPVTRIPDISDVWLESSVASWSALDYPLKTDKFEKYWPANLVLEGRDQITYWFNVQLQSSVLMFDKAPYKNVLVNSWMLDEAGVKMSKSLGNVVSPNELIEGFGRDATRMYFATLPADASVNHSQEDLKQMKRSLDVLWNAYKFTTTYMNLDTYDPNTAKTMEKQVEDKWLESKLNSLVRDCTQDFEAYKFQKAVLRMHDFILNDLSRWYIKLIRGRVWSEGADMSKLAAYDSLHKTFVTLSKLMAPITPFMSDAIYKNLVYNVNSNEPESVHFTEWPKTQENLIDADLEQSMEVAKHVVESGLASRNKAKVKLRWPVKEVTVFTDDLFVNRTIDMLESIIASQLNAKQVTAIPFEESKTSKLALTELPKALVGVSSELDAELYKEAMSREVIRRVQQMRKELDLKENDKILSEIVAPKEFLDLIQSHKDSIQKETRSEKLLLSESETLKGYQTESNIESNPVKITVQEKPKEKK